MSNCRHYQRRCSLVSPCCSKVYRCRFCHDEQENHHLDRSIVKKLFCRQCETVQPLGDHCIECSISFGLYTCLICRLFDDTDKKQFHCDKCQVCRVGGRENFIHCDGCGLCLRKDNLQRTKRFNEQEVCPVCLEVVDTGSLNTRIPSCGHFIHAKCSHLGAPRNSKKKVISNCSHYVRKCSFITPCCNKIYPCRFCHDEEENHVLDRHRVEELKCRQCHKKQSVSSHCTECGTLFAIYICFKCCFFDDSDRGQFHCDKCAKCLVGGADNYFHCDECEACFPKSGKHKCQQCSCFPRRNRSVVPPHH